MHSLKKILFLTAVLMAMGADTGISQSPIRILVLPFTIHSEKDLSFLQNGILDMLSTRLSTEGKTSVIPKEAALSALEGVKEITPSGIASLGKKIDADLVVFGSLTVFGDSISTDARIYDVNRGKETLTFTETGKGNGDVITHVNAFAAKVNAELFGRKEAPSAASVAKPPETDISQKHPETLWTGKIEAEKRKTGADEKEEKSPLGEAWRSRNFSTDIQGMTLTDVDGDGKLETVFIDAGEVHIHRYAEGRFIKLGSVKADTSDKLVSVDAADINGNGLSEIFVTAVHTDNSTLRSFVLEWDGKQIQQIVDGAGWYFRVLRGPGARTLLFGQSGGGSRVFSAGVYELIWTGGRYDVAERKTLPSYANVFSFNMGDLKNDGRETVITFNEKDDVKVLDADGREEWESPETYGGSNTYIEYPMEASASIGGHKEKSRYYLPLRILIADTDKDGKNEVFIAKNKDAANRLFSRLRLYKGGHIECLAWDNFGLYPKWKTREVSGYISDYAIGDIDGDGKDELVFSVIQKISSVLGEAKSFIAAYDIN